MTQDTQVVQDDEDQMAAEFAAIRADRAEEPTPAADPIQEPVQAQAPVDEEQTSTQEPAQAEAATPVDPAEQLKATQAELHKMRSEIGRVSALNHKYLQAAQEAAALREQLAQAQRAPATPADTEVTQDRLAAVAEQVKDFPELAGIVSAVSDALKQADRKTEEVARRVAAQVVEPLEPLRREQTSRIQSEQQAAYDASLATFNSAYPTAVQVIQSEDFKSWLAVQPSNIQYAFHKGQTPDEAMTVLDTYDMHLRRTGKPTVAQINQSQSEQQTAPVRSAANVSRLQRAAGIPSRTAGSQGSAPPSDDFDASLAYFRNKRLAAARASA